MLYRSITCALLFSTLLMSGCASFKAPVRPDYTGADNVSTADDSQLIGTWRVIELNPYSDNESQTTTIEYRNDGTVTGLVIPKGEGMEALGNLEFELTGNWALSDDVVTHQHMTMSSSGGNTMGNVISSLVNGRPALSGQANIYELSETRIVMVGSDGVAFEYVRQ